MNDLVVSFLVSNVMAVLMMAIAIVYGLCGHMEKKDVGIMSLIMIESYFFVMLFLLLTGLAL